MSYNEYMIQLLEATPTIDNTEYCINTCTEDVVRQFCAVFIVGRTGNDTRSVIRNIDSNIKLNMINLLLAIYQNHFNDVSASNFDAEYLFDDDRAEDLHDWSIGLKQNIFDLLIK